MRNKFIYPLWGLAILMLGLLLGMTINRRGEAAAPPRSYLENLEKFQDAVRYLNANYFEDINNDKLVEDAINGMLTKLDPHTFYITADEMAAMEEQMRGSFDGIGIEFNILNDTLYVVTALSGGPSEKLGIQAGDRILKVDGENIAGIKLQNSDVVKRLRGPKGSKVHVSVYRKGIAGLLEFDITRDAIPVYSVDYSYMPQPTVGYMKVSRFAENTFREFREHLGKLKKQGMQSLILDLRGNPGGYMSIAQQMADDFLEEGRLVVYTDGRIPSSKSRYTATSLYNDFEKGALIVLIDEGSASASEIVSGAVQDWDRGLLVGTRSFGKGLVQQQHDLGDGSAIRVVVSRYFTPSGRCIQKPFEGKTGEEYEAEVYGRYQSGEVYDESKIAVPDSMKFKTHSGRVVYGGGGVIPDVFVADDTSGYSKYLFAVNNAGHIRTFGYEYFDKHPELKTEFKNGLDFAQRFELTEATLQAFINFATSKGTPFVEADYRRSKAIISNLLKSQVGHAAFGDDATRPVLHQMDSQFQKALQLIPQAKQLESTGNFEYKMSEKQR